MQEITLNHPPIIKPVTVELVRKWSDWDAGDRITTDAEKAKRMIAKGYGVEVQKPAAKPQRAEMEKTIPPAPEKAPEVETATAEPAPETAEVAPRRRKRGERGGD